MSEVKCPHDLYETAGGWWCRVCGKPIMPYHRVSFLRVWAECRDLRRKIEDWKNG